MRTALQRRSLRLSLWSRQRILQAPAPAQPASDNRLSGASSDSIGLIDDGTAVAGTEASGRVDVESLVVFTVKAQSFDLSDVSRRIDA